MKLKRTFRTLLFAAPLVLLVIPLWFVRGWFGGPAPTSIADPSFEETQPKNRFGHVFAKWGGWIYDGDCEFRVSDIAHTGKHSLLMVGSNQPKIRAWPTPQLQLPPGRYRVTAYLRGLEIGVGAYGMTTEFMFDEKYIPLKKNGTFGWTKLTFVGDITKKREVAHPSFGLLAPGFLWVDDVTLEKVGLDVPLTPEPVWGPEESKIAPPGPLGNRPVHCPLCGYRNNPEWGKCFGCGTSLTESQPAVDRPDGQSITSFESANPFAGGAIVEQHATDGKKALRLDKGFISMDRPQSWTGYDYLKADFYSPAAKPMELTIEIRDAQTTDYWTRVNFTTVVPPGQSTLTLPTNLYVGEKSRPGRALLRDRITRLVFSIGDHPAGPLFVDNVRLERDTETAKVRFDGLYAFDVGPAGSPLMDGFTPLDDGKQYSPSRGFGWKNVRIWRGFNALQPDPLYQDFLCVEAGGLAIDVPNGRYHVFVNMDSPSGYWGEVQKYRKRALILEGKRFEDRMNFRSFKDRYYRHFGHDDLPSHDTFDTYQIPYFQEKRQVVDVRDGQLNIDFEGSDWACCVSAIIVFPDDKRAEGERFLEYVRERRRFHFNNAFKRVLPPITGEEPTPTALERDRGFIPFVRDFMKDVNVQDRPLPGERVEKLTPAAFAGELTPIVVSMYPLQDLGKVTVDISDLDGPGTSRIPKQSVRLGYVEHRLSRVTDDGAVYTIAPRWVIPQASAPVPKGVTRSFWLTMRTPADAAPGVYRGSVRVDSEQGGSYAWPVEFTVLPGKLDEVDIPAGPWGHTINLPWFEDETAQWNTIMADNSLKRLKSYGFTTATGLPMLTYRGFRGGAPQIDFTQADQQMKLFRANGFQQPVVTYCPLIGLDLYYRDENAMRAAGFSNYAQFVRSVFGSIQQHAVRANWLPVYWNIADEPLGDDLIRAAENAEAYRQAFPGGPPLFTGASSMKGSDRSNPHFRLSKALHVANWHDHDDASVQLLRESGGHWAFYNSGNRWSYGVYMYKVAKERDMKFRVAWHWNNVAGDPYYALDCREDDFAWCNSTPEGELVPSVMFERLREGLGDYRRLLTLARLARDNPEAANLLREILTPIRIGQLDIRDVNDYARTRDRMNAVIAKTP